MATIPIEVIVQDGPSPEPTPTPTPDTNIIPNCTEAGKDDNGNNVCKVCADGYTLENNQCVKANVENTEEPADTGNFEG